MVEVVVHGKEFPREIMPGCVFAWTERDPINSHYAGQPLLLTFEGLVLLSDPSATWKFGKDDLHGIIQVIKKHIKNGYMVYLGELKKIEIWVE